MHRILLAAAALAATTFLAASPAGAAMGGDPGDASVTIRYGDNGHHYGDDRWRRWHRWHSMDRGWGYQHRPAYGSFRHDRCHIRIVTRERAGRMVTVRKEVCF